ncbi:MAG TPA: hypothetical protein DD789_02210 [Firmicutes bacterium]|jgi:hypothetical protein|nr:hypothetical protein [Bacillota bacterium]
MRKLGLNPVFRLLLIFITVVLFVCSGAGCGKKSSPKAPQPPPKEPTVNTIQFSIPEFYEELGGLNKYRIPDGQRINFYVAIPTSNPESVIESLQTFTGTTGNRNFQFIIPDSLNNEEGEVFAVIDLTGTYDLNGKTISQAREAAAVGEILFGNAGNVIFKNNQVAIFDFWGNGEGHQSVITISFTMPSLYEAGDFEFNIPAGKEVVFYSVASAPEPGSMDTFNTDFSCSTLTVRETSNHILPDALDGQDRYFLATVILQGSFELQGQTWTQIQDAINSGTILLGQAKDPMDENVKMLYSLYDGIEIGNFKFVGAVPDVSNPKITFRLPSTCVSGTPIPNGKPVKIYTTGDFDETFISDHVFTGTTGADITCDLPSKLIGEERDLYVVVILKGSFDPEGKSDTQLTNAIINEEIMLGVIEDVVRLSPGMLIDADAFEFYGKADYTDDGDEED